MRKYITGVIRIFFPTEKSFRESEEKKHNIQDKKMLLFIHGGGWVTESIDNYERICARLTNATGQYVVAVEYRLAPEDKFPAGLEDCYAVAKTLYSGDFMLNIKPENITLIGDSAGGNLCAALSLMARDCGEFMPKRQILSIRLHIMIIQKIHHFHLLRKMEQIIF